MSLIIVKNTFLGGVIFIKKLTNYLALYIRSFRLFGHAAPGASILLIALVPIQAIAPALLLSVGQHILDSLQVSTSVTTSVYVWAALFFISAATTPISTSIQGILTDKMIAFVNLKLMNKSKQIVGLGAFEDADFYDQLQLLSSEASWRPVNLIVFGISTIREIISTAAMLWLIGRYNWLIALLILAAAIPQSIVSYRVQQDAFETMVTRSPDARKLQYYSSALLSRRDAKEVRLFGLFDFFIDAYRNLYAKIHKQVRNVRVKQMWTSLLSQLLSSALSVVGLVWFVIAIKNGRINAGSFLIFVSALTSIASSLYALIENSSMLYDTLLYMQKYFVFMQYQEAELSSGQRQLPKPMGAIHFNHVFFKYTNQATNALNDVSLTINPGERIAVVGENGAGKSTLIKLLLRFYNPQRGDIRLDDVNINEYSIVSLRQNISAVFQDFSKFTLPLGEAIGVGNPAAMTDKGRIKQATQATGFDQVMQAKKIQLSTQLGPEFAGGIDLSGGEWQKLAIARAFMADSQLMILDEPTAALDPRSENEVYQNFIKLAQDKTVIFVTHRLAAVKLADKVLVLRNGQIVGFDTHATLMLTNSYYSEFYNLQADGYK